MTTGFPPLKHLPTTPGVVIDVFTAGEAEGDPETVERFIRLPSTGVLDEEWWLSLYDRSTWSLIIDKWCLVSVPLEIVAQGLYEYAESREMAPAALNNFKNIVGAGIEGLGGDRDNAGQAELEVELAEARETIARLRQGKSA